MNPIVPSAALVVTCAIAARVRRGAPFAGLCAAAGLASLVLSRRTWEADVRRMVYMASRARGLRLDRAVDLLFASAVVALAATLRRSSRGFVVAALLAAAAIVESALAR